MRRRNPQPHDLFNGLSSTLGDFYSYRAADDFTVEDDFTIESLTFWMIVTYLDVPGDFGFELYEQVEELGELKPAVDPFLQVVGPSSIIDHGVWRDYNHLRFFEIHYDNLNIALTGDTYWVVSHGIGSGPSEASFWGTSGRGVINGSEAHLKGGINQDYWFPGSDLFGFSTDLAMRIEGTVIPAPSALFAFACAILGLRGTRRRRT